jgi:hypothetical protein
MTRTRTATFTVTPTRICNADIAITDPLVIISNNFDPPGDDRLRVRGRFAVASQTPAINPIRNGLRFTLYNRFNGNELLSFVIPPGMRLTREGPGWHANGTNTRFTYEDRNGLRTPGIRRVTVVHKITTAVGLYEVSVYGRDGSFHIEPSELPLRLDIVLGGEEQAAAGQCGTGFFNVESARSPNCGTAQAGDTISCR